MVYFYLNNLRISKQLEIRNNKLVWVFKLLSAAEAGDAAVSPSASETNGTSSLDTKPENSSASNDAQASTSDSTSTSDTVTDDTPKETVSFKVIYNKQKFDVTFPLDDTILSLKAHIQTFTGR